MSRRSSKYFNLWLLIIAATLYFPFQQFLKAKDYSTADAFFEELLQYAIVAAFIVVPLAFMLMFRRKKKQRHAERTQKPSDTRSRRR